LTSANADDRKRTLLNVSITKDNKALDAEPPIASLLKSRMIGGGPVNAAVRHPGIQQPKVEARMSTDISIEAMSVAEKVRLLESVWVSLCAHPGDVQSPEWHREVLEDHRRRLEDGRATVSTWADAKARLMHLGR
jgi:hypothetical protein